MVIDTILKKQWKRDTAFRGSILLLIFVLSFTLYYVIEKRILLYYSSDPAFYLIAGKDIMVGNILLEGWYGSRNCQYVISVVYGLFGELFGYSFALIPLVCAFFWACMLTLIVGILLHQNMKSPLQSGIRGGFAFALCFLSCYVWQPDGIFGGAHFDVVLIGIFYIWVSSREIEECKNNTLLLAIASILLFFAAWSDNLTAILIVLPAVGGLVLELLFYTKEDMKKRYVIKHIVLLIAIFSAAKVFLSFLQSTGRLIIAPAKIVVQEYSELFINIAYFLKSVLHLFGCDFFGQSIGIDSWALFLRLLLLAVLIFGLILSRRAIFRNYFNRVMLFCVAIEALMIVFTSEGSNSLDGSRWTSRLLYCLFFSMVLLFAQIDLRGVMALFEIEARGKKQSVLEIFVVCLILLLDFFTISHHMHEPYDLAQTTEGQLANVLTERKLTKGFGTFWLANSVTVASQFQTDVMSVVGEDLSAYHWLSKDKKGWDYANFVIVDGSGWGSVTEESIIDSVGTPNERITVNDAIILVWDKNILPYINGSGYQGETMDAWWSMEVGQTEKTIEITDRHFYSEFASNEYGYFTSTAAGWLVYGPFRPMSVGTYDITFEYDYDGTLERGEVLGAVDVSSNTMKVNSTSCSAVSGENNVTLKDVQIFPECMDFEILFYANTESITVRRIVIERTGT